MFLFGVVVTYSGVQTMKSMFVKDLASMTEGVSFDGFFLAVQKQTRTTKSNKPYLVVTLADKTGQIEGRAWEITDPRVEADFAAGQVVKIRGAVNRFDDRLQVKIDQLRIAHEGEVSKADFMPATSRDVDQMWATLMTRVERVENSLLKTLLKSVLGDQNTAAAFREAPAAKSVHHAWLGGLLEHVVSLLSLIDQVAPLYPLLNVDLLVTGAILHDIGKTRELTWQMGISYSLEGELLGHIPMGASLVEQAIDAIDGFPLELKVLVLHIILSHHGKMEWGSPKVPMIAEALVLHTLDELDAKMQAVSNEFEKSIAEGKPAAEFTGKIYALDQRSLLNAGRLIREICQ